MTTDLTPTADEFRALARSSPWRWATLEFIWTWGSHGGSARHAWVRKPNDVRVEHLDGAVDQVLTKPRPLAGQQYNDASTGYEWKPVPGRWAHEVAPRYRPDGLVGRRPDNWGVDYDLPLYGDYHWVAMLDPAEFADAADSESDPDATAPVDLEELQVVDHHGRLAWEAIAVPTPNYEPRCPCCALLAGEFDDGEQCWIPMGPSRIRLDVQTGVCVFTEYVGRTGPHLDFDVNLRAVDVSMGDLLFTPTARRPWIRRQRK